MPLTIKRPPAKCFCCEEQPPAVVLILSTTLQLFPCVRCARRLIGSEYAYERLDRLPDCVEVRPE